jgi:hypothetical protein
MKENEIFEEEEKEEEKELSDENDIEENKNNNDLSVSPKTEESDIEEDIKNQIREKNNLKRIHLNKICLMKNST